MSKTTKRIILAVVVIAVGYFVIHKITKKTPPPTYIIGTVQQGTIVSSITGTGQIGTSQTVNLQPQVSGQLTAIHAQAGDAVTKGEPLFSIDDTDAARAVETAKENLASAELDLSSTQDQNTTSVSDDSKAVADAYTALLSSDLQAQPNDTTTAGFQAPTISGNYSLGTEGTITITTYNSQGGVSFSASGLATGQGLTDSVVSQPIGASGLYILFPSNTKGGLSWTISIPNKNSSSYISNENAYENAQQTQTEDNDPNGTDAVNLQSKQLAVAQAQNSLDSAEETLAEYTVTAPFTGTLATVPVNVGDQVSSGTTLGTIITNEEVATLSLNEVDVSKVQVGQKATLTFDAIDGLSLAGTVATIDPVGTVSSGVVNYTVTISLDTQDPQVKSGMTVTAAIETAVAENVLEVPSGAVKTATNGSYVLTPPAGTPATTGTTGVPLTSTTETPVQVGITDGTNTEIISGLNAGDPIITKTVMASTTGTKTTTTTAPSLLGGGTGAARGGAGGGGFGGAARL